MRDVQSERDTREIDIDQVGVCGLRYPITVLDRAREKQQTIAQVELSVSLPHHFKGTHMSRFVEVFEDHRGEVTSATIPLILADLRSRLDAEVSHLEVRFPYFVEKQAPATGATSLLDVEAWFRGQTSEEEGDDFIVGMRAPVTSLCPCSKAISEYGAHNQRGHLSLEVRGRRGEDGQPAMIWIEELVEMAEASASAPVYALLKRPDERHVTMQAYDNPAFVEDMVRNAAQRLLADERVAWFRVEAVNEESIHNHNAFARIERWVPAGDDEG